MLQVPFVEYLSSCCYAEFEAIIHESVNLKGVICCKSQRVSHPLQISAFRVLQNFD